MRKVRVKKCKYDYMTRRTTYLRQPSFHVKVRENCISFYLKTSGFLTGNAFPTFAFWKNFSMLSTIKHRGAIMEVPMLLLIIFCTLFSVAHFRMCMKSDL